FKVVDKNTKETFIFDNSLLLNEKQRKRLNTSDVIWQMAQKIKAYYALENKEVEVYCHRSRISINGKSFRRYIDPTVDLTKEKWPYFKAADWILEPNPPLKTFQEKVPLVHQPLQMSNIGSNRQYLHISLHHHLAVKPLVSGDVRIYNNLDVFLLLFALYKG